MIVISYIPIITKVNTKDNMILEVTFNDGTIKSYDCNQLISRFDWYEDLKNNDLFRAAYIDCGGHGITWNEDIDVSEWEIWDNGTNIL